uniref:Uncharacterized protein n=1 Tax=Oncorhynchus mykiss TaxID=8022 RepID=A0A8C7Q0A2_ONCMY
SVCFCPSCPARMETQTLMQNHMRKREFLKYFFSLASLGLTIGRGSWPSAPVIPLSFVLAYQMDMAYGTHEAESTMVSEQDRLDIPSGVPNFVSIEKVRRAP